MRIFGLTLVLMIFVVLVANIAAIVQDNNGIPNPMEALFPGIFVDKEQQQALETQIAPFADPRSNDEVDDAGLGIAYTPLQGEQRVAIDMNLPHLHEGAVNKWVMQVMAEALTFSVVNLSAYQLHQSILPQFMSANGLKEYNSFLRRIRAEELMRSNNYELRTFVDGTPILRTSGVVGGVFRWVYDVPVIMTFLPQGTTDYREYTSNSGDQFVTEEVSIRIQIGRVAQGGRDGMVIETWDMLKKR